MAPSAAASAASPIGRRSAGGYLRPIAARSERGAGGAARFSTAGRARHSLWRVGGSHLERTPDDPARRLDGALDRAGEHETIPRVDGLVAVSEESRHNLLDEVPDAAAVPHRIVPNFLQRPTISGGAPTRGLITIGTLERRKNQRYLVEVVAAARALGRDVTARTGESWRLRRRRAG